MIFCKPFLTQYLSFCNFNFIAQIDTKFKYYSFENVDKKKKDTKLNNMEDFPNV